MKIFLIGFMGSGKTTTGKAVAQKMQYRFIDLDSYIQKKQGKTITELFNTAGENKFREIEQACLNEIIQVKENSIIATGGGTPCFNDTMELLNKHGVTFYLELPEDILFTRLQFEKSNRPLINKLSETELKSYISQKLQERKGYYEQAQYVINLSENDIIDEIIRILKI